MRIYDTPEWAKLRKRVLLRDNWHCTKCGKNVTGKYNAHVDHIEAVRKRPDLAFELSNLQTLCQKCHNQIKQLEEVNTEPPAGKDGFPTDPNHPWNM